MFVEISVIVQAWNTASETTQHLVELRVVEEVGSVSVNQGAEGQAILPASPVNTENKHVRS